MTYPELWHDIERRLTSALGLLKADAPAVAAGADLAVREWLDHNELALALDEIVGAVSGSSAPVRRQFWEELLLAAMLMRLGSRFAEITACITGLEPHVFGVAGGPPHLNCDFNGRIDTDVYSLDSVGTALDAARLRLLPAPGLHVILYDADALEDGTPAWMLADAQILDRPQWGLVAVADPRSYRWQRR